MAFLRDAAAEAFRSVHAKLQKSNFTEEQILQAARRQAALAPLAGITPEEVYELAMRGHAVLMAGYYDEALDIFKILDYIDSPEPYFVNALGACLLGQDKVVEAERKFRIAIALKPDDAAPHVNLGE